MTWKSRGRTQYTDDDVIVPSGSGYGVKLGNPEDLSVGWGWRDITSPIEVRGVKATDPTWAQVASTDFYAYKFGIGDYVWQTAHIPHDIVPGSDIHFHVHWFPATATSPMSTNAVTFEFEYVYAKGFNQQAFDFALSSPASNSGIVYCTDNAPTVLYQHMVTETAAVTLPDLTEPDGLVHYRVQRVNNQTSPIADYTGDVYILTTDIHYQSTNLATVGKAPSFYG